MIAPPKKRKVLAAKERTKTFDVKANLGFV